MKFQKIALTTLSVAAAWMFVPSAAFAQGTGSFPLMTKSCPSNFKEQKGMCVSKGGDWVGYFRGKNSCATNYRSSGEYCIFSASDKAADDDWKGKMESGTLTWARKPVTASVPKAKEEDFCPTGYFSHRTNLKVCMTHYKDAPASRLATGGKCNAGETLERGTYCTVATTMSAKEIDAAMTADFNELYTGLGIKNGKMPELNQTPPEVGAPLLAALNAEKDAQRAKDKAANDQRLAAANAEQTAKDNETRNNLRMMCEQSRPNFVNGIPPAGSPCAELLSTGGAPAGGSAAAAAGPLGAAGVLGQAAAAAQNPQQAVKSAQGPIWSLIGGTQ
jgi:hypothetical protein